MKVLPNRKESYVNPRATQRSMWVDGIQTTKTSRKICDFCGGKKNVETLSHTEKRCYNCIIQHGPYERCFKCSDTAMKNRKNFYFIGDSLYPTATFVSNATDHSKYCKAVRRLKPDIVCTLCGGNEYVVFGECGICRTDGDKGKWNDVIGHPRFTLLLCSDPHCTRRWTGYESNGSGINFSSGNTLCNIHGHTYPEWMERSEMKTDHANVWRQQSKKYRKKQEAGIAPIAQPSILSNTMSPEARIEELMNEVNKLKNLYQDAILALRKLEKNLEVVPSKQDPVQETAPMSVEKFTQTKPLKAPKSNPTKPTRSETVPEVVASSQESVVAGDPPFYGTKSQWILRYTKTVDDGELVDYSCNCVTISSLIYAGKEKDQSLVILRCLTVDHYDTKDDKMSLTESTPVRCEPIFPPDHPMYDREVYKVFINPCVTNEMLAEIWICYLVNGIDQRAAFKSTVLDMFVLDSTREVDISYGCKVKVSTLGTETLKQVTVSGTIGKVTGIGGEGGETIKGFSMNCSIVNPDSEGLAMSMQGGGSSGSVVFVSKGGRYKPCGLHFGGFGKPFYNYGYSIPNTIPKTPSAVLSFINQHTSHD